MSEHLIRGGLVVGIALFVNADWAGALLGALLGLDLALRLGLACLRAEIGHGLAVDAGTATDETAVLEIVSALVVAAATDAGVGNAATHQGLLSGHERSDQG